MMTAEDAEEKIKLLTVDRDVEKCRRLEAEAQLANYQDFVRKIRGHCHRAGDIADELQAYWDNLDDLLRNNP